MHPFGTTAGVIRVKKDKFCFFPLESWDTGLSANGYLNEMVIKLTLSCWAAIEEMKKTHFKVLLVTSGGGILSGGPYECLINQDPASCRLQWPVGWSEIVLFVNFGNGHYTADQEITETLKTNIFVKVGQYLKFYFKEHLPKGNLELRLL